MLVTLIRRGDGGDIDLTDLSDRPWRIGMNLRSNICLRDRRTRNLYDLRCQGYS